MTTAHTHRGASVSFLLSSLHQEILILNVTISGGKSKGWDPQVRTILLMPLISRLTSLATGLASNLQGDDQVAVGAIAVAASELIERDDEAALKALTDAFDKAQARFPTTPFL
jgi:hypothetical protein